MSGVQTVIRNLKYTARNQLGSYPLTYPLLGFNSIFKHRLVTTSTNICIEGFPRSANSFALHAFLTFNPHAKVAHHLHVPMQIIESARLRVPCLVLIRRPEDALASLLTIDNDLSITLSLKSYINFYSRLRPVRKDFLIGEFSTVIQNFDKLILAVNARFETRYKVDVIDNQTRDEIFNRLAEHHNKAALPENLIPIPTIEKERLKLGLKNEIIKHPLFATAERIFQEFCPTEIQS